MLYIYNKKTMKKLIILLIAIVLFSCTKENIEPTNQTTQLNDSLWLHVAIYNNPDLSPLINVNGFETNYIYNCTTLLDIELFNICVFISENNTYLINSDAIMRINLINTVTDSMYVNEFIYLNEIYSNGDTLYDNTIYF